MKDTIEGMKRRVTDWGTYLQNKNLVKAYNFSILKCLRLNNKKTQKWEKTWTLHKRVCKDIKYMKQ